MKVTRVEIFLVGHEWNNLVITRVHTDNGLSGLGEGTMQWQARTVASAIDHMATRYVLGASPFEIERLVQAMYRNEYARGGPGAEQRHCGDRVRALGHLRQGPGPAGVQSARRTGPRRNPRLRQRLVSHRERRQRSGRRRAEGGRRGLPAA